MNVCLTFRGSVHCCRYVSSASLETLGQAFKDATLLMQRNYEIFYEELKLSCYRPQVTQKKAARGASFFPSAHRKTPLADPSTQTLSGTPHFETGRIMLFSHTEPAGYEKGNRQQYYGMHPPGYAHNTNVLLAMTKRQVPFKVSLHPRLTASTVYTISQVSTRLLAACSLHSRQRQRVGVHILSA